MNNCLAAFFFEFITPQYENKKGIILLVTSEISIYQNTTVLIKKHSIYIV